VSALALWIADRVPPDMELDENGCDEVARAIVTEESLWRAHVHHDEQSRFYTQLYRDPALDVWLICWTNRQDTGYHDHDRSNGAVCVAEGALLEDFFQRDGDGWIREKTNRHDVGGSFHFEASYIHGVRHVGQGATSIHVYSPALWRMGHYEHDGAGIMRRVSLTYADELLA
jgi:Cysteine dioxygenase type I